MKYIRTKDGKIFDLDKIELCAEYYCIDDENQLYIEWYAVKETFEIINQADTIEELCDLFVYVYEEGKPFVDAWFAADKWAKYIYGAIWTDKGLQYVARMNSDGELELL